MLKAKEELESIKEKIQELKKQRNEEALKELEKDQVEEK